MSLKLYDAAGVNTYAVRLFILERGGLELDVEQIDITTLQNRRLAYRTNVNSRGEVPALRVGDQVITEITAVCEYLDEIATGGESLFGKTALERAETRMWLRRMDLEIAQPVIAWFRDDPATIDFYKGNRLPTPEARVNGKVVINQFLNRLDDELEGKKYLAGDRFSAADIHFYGLLRSMVSGPQAPAPWVLAPGRTNFLEYFERMGQRTASQEAMSPFESRVKV